jgi:hypothetical protein
MVMLGSVCRPKLRSPAGHRGRASEHAGVSEGREVGDDLRGGLSARERGRARAGARQVALLGRVAGPSARERRHARAGRSARPDRREGGDRPGSGFVFVFLFQINE